MTKVKYEKHKLKDGSELWVNPNCRATGRGIAISDKLVVPAIYTGFYGSIHDNIMIAYKMVWETQPSVVDYDIDVYSLDKRYDSDDLYLVDKEGHAMFLKSYENPQITYEGKQYDGAVCFRCKYRTESDWECHTKREDYYQIYFEDDKDYVTIDINWGEKTFLLYFNGKREYIDPKAREKNFKYHHKSKKLANTL